MKRLLTTVAGAALLALTAGHAFADEAGVCANDGCNATNWISLEHPFHQTGVWTTTFNREDGDHPVCRTGLWSESKRRDGLQFESDGVVPVVHFWLQEFNDMVPPIELFRQKHNPEQGGLIRVSIQIDNNPPFIFGGEGDTGEVQVMGTLDEGDFLHILAGTHETTGFGR